MVHDLRVIRLPLGAFHSLCRSVRAPIEGFDICSSDRLNGAADDKDEMIIGLAYLLVLLSVPIARGRLDALADLPLRRSGLALAAIVIQIAVISILPGGD